MGDITIHSPIVNMPLRIAGLVSIRLPLAVLFFVLLVSDLLFTKTISMLDSTGFSLLLPSVISLDGRQ